MSLRSVEKIQNIKSVVLRELAHDADRRFALRALQIAEEANRDAHGLRHYRERLSAFHAKLAELWTQRRRLVGRKFRSAFRYQTLLLELPEDRERVHTLNAAQIDRAAQSFQVFVLVNAISAVVRVGRPSQLLHARTWKQRPQGGALRLDFQRLANAIVSCSTLNSSLLLIRL